MTINISCLRRSLVGLLFLPALSVWAQMPEMPNVTSGAQLQLKQISEQITLSITNPNKTALTDAPVCVAIPQGTTFKSATVTLDGREIPSQMDDLNGDGVKDELAFVIDIKKKKTVSVQVTFSRKEADKDRYPARVAAQMFFADKNKSHNPKQHIPTDTVSEIVDNMYNVMHHHGPAFESELVAYRLYFDRKQTSDLYGKKIPQLELADGLWYSSQNPTLSERKFGDDIIRVYKTVGVGTLRGWDETQEKDPMVMIFPFAWRQAHIVAKGPIRTIVDMNVQGWQYKGKNLNLKSRYTLYAGARDCQVIQQFEGDTQGVEFVTGVMKVGATNTDSTEIANPQQYSDDKGLCASWGKDWPDGNRKFYPTMQTAGLAVSLPTDQVTRTIETKDQLLYGLHTDENNAICYKISFCAPDKETYVKKAWIPKRWFDYAQKWNKTLPLEVKIQ